MKRALSVMAVFLLLLTSCNKEIKSGNQIVAVNGSFAAISDTGLSIISSSGESNKTVGVFYSIWHGANLSGPTGTYDNTEILERLGSLEGKGGIVIQDWIKNGGGTRSTFHWWGKPLFGYYTTTDEWVLSKHVQMLTDADVDFLVIDFTNGAFPARAADKRDVSYTGRLLLLLKTLNFYGKQDYDVPAVTCYTYTNWENTVNILYDEVYKTHPEYSHLWFKWGNNDKPLIIGNPLGYDGSMNGLNEECEDFFDIKDGAFPHESKNSDLIPDISSNGSILWMDFRAIPEKVPVDDKSYVSISTSEINVTNRASEQWFYDTKDRTKSWDGQQNRNRLAGEEDAYLYGYNFERQFKAAIEQNPDTIIITGWNEWIAELQYDQDTKKIGFIDMADINNNRDIEPMAGGYGDNYYMQLIHWISKFKSTAAKVDTGENISIDVSGSFEQWDSHEITAVYRDYVKEISGRNSFEAYDWSKPLTNDAGVNDFAFIKVAKDNDNLYFYVSTADNIVTGSRLMSLFINTMSGYENSWYGYDFVVNRSESGNGKMILEKRSGNVWVKLNTLDCKVEENKLMLKIPLDYLDMSGRKVNLQFKWADNYAEDNIWSFYTDGDTAPYGRMNFVFNE